METNSVIDFINKFTDFRISNLDRLRLQDEFSLGDFEYVKEENKLYVKSIFKYINFMSFMNSYLSSFKIKIDYKILEKEKPSYQIMLYNDKNFPIYLYNRQRNSFYVFEKHIKRIFNRNHLVYRECPMIEYSAYLGNRRFKKIFDIVVPDIFRNFKYYKQIAINLLDLNKETIKAHKFFENSILLSGSTEDVVVWKGEEVYRNYNSIPI